MLPFVIKQFFFLLKTFPNNSHLYDSGISLPASLSRTNLKKHNFSLTAKLIKKIITNLDVLKKFGPDCISVVVLKKCEPELSYVSLLNSSVGVSKSFVIQIIGRSYLWSLYLRILGRSKHLIYPRLSARFGIQDFVCNSSFMQF